MANQIIAPPPGFDVNRMLEADKQEAFAKAQLAHNMRVSRMQCATTCASIVIPNRPQEQDWAVTLRQIRELFDFCYREED